MPNTPIGNLPTLRWQADNCTLLGPLIKVLLIDKVSWCKYNSCSFKDCFIHKQAHSCKYYECSQAEFWRTTPLTDTRRQNGLVSIRVIALVSVIYWWRGQGIHNKRFREPWFEATAAVRAPLQKINVKQRYKKGFTLQQCATAKTTTCHFQSIWKSTCWSADEYKIPILFDFQQQHSTFIFQDRGKLWFCIRSLGSSALTKLSRN